MSLVAGVRHLVALGFSEIEADAYVFLLRESPATGYRVAQGIGRTAANTYKALESLEARGVALVEEADPRLYRAVALDELLRSIDKTFRRHRDRAADILGRLAPQSADDRVYRLKTPAQVLERCVAMLEGARHVALLDVFPEPLAELRSAISSAIARGVRTALLVYEPTTLDGATVVENHQSTIVRGRWPGRWVNLAIDSVEQVHALMTPDGSEVVHAMWSASPFLAHLYQSGLLGELLASAIRRAIRNGASSGDIDQLVQRLAQFEHVDTPAFAELTSAPLRRARPRRKESR